MKKIKYDIIDSQKEQKYLNLYPNYVLRFLENHMIEVNLLEPVSNPDPYYRLIKVVEGDIKKRNKDLKKIVKILLGTKLYKNFNFETHYELSKLSFKTYKVYIQYNITTAEKSSGALLKLIEERFYG